MSNVFSRQYSQKGNMKAHIESVHDGIKNHQCEICGKSFALNTDLKRHIQKVHEGHK